MNITLRPWSGFKANFFFVAGCLILLCFRAPDRFLNPQLVVEDGPIFFLRSHVFGWRSLLLQFQAGYEVLALKLVALICRPLPPAWIPLAYAFYCLMLHAAVLSYCLSERIRMRHKYLAALVLVFNPADPELYFSLTFSVWISAVLLLLVLVSEMPKSQSEKLVDALIILIFGLTGPFSLLWVPLFAWRAWRVRDGWNGKKFALILICAALQFMSLLDGYQDRAGESFSMDGAAWRLAVLSIFARPLWTPRFAGLSEIWQFVFIGLMLHLYSLLIVKQIRRNDLQGFSFLVCSAVVGLLAMFTYRAAPGFLVINSGRYCFLPMITVIWCLLQTEFLGVAKVYRIVVGALFLFGSVLMFRAEPLTDYKWREASECFLDKTPCHIPLNYDKNRIDFESHSMIR